MQRRLKTLLVITPICLSACGVLDPVVCTLEARFGVSVQVVDAASGTALAEGSISRRSRRIPSPRKRRGVSERPVERPRRLRGLGDYLL